jgi:hypothetical protein
VGASVYDGLLAHTRRRRSAVQHTGQEAPLSVDVSDTGLSYSVNTQGANAGAAAQSAAAAYLASSGDPGSQALRKSLAETMLSVVPVLGWLAQGAIAAVGWAQGGGGVCADGQPHSDLFGTWESNIGSYDASKGRPLTSNIAGSRIFAPVSAFEAAAYTALRTDYDSGLTCKTYGVPPVPLGAVLVTLIQAYNKAHPNNTPTTYVRRWTTTKAGTWQGQQIPGTAVDRWSNDPITLALEDEVAAQVVNQPIGNTVDPVVGLVAGRVVTVSFAVNDGPPSTGSNIPTGGKLIPAGWTAPPPKAPPPKLAPIKPAPVGGSAAAATLRRAAASWPVGSPQYNRLIAAAKAWGGATPASTLPPRPSKAPLVVGALLTIITIAAKLLAP